MTASRTTYQTGQHPILKDRRFARPQGHSVTYHAQTSQQPKPKFSSPEVLPAHALPGRASSPDQAHAARMHGAHSDYLAHLATTHHDDATVQPTLVNFDVDLNYDPNAPRKPAQDLRFVEGAMLAMPADISDYIGWEESGFLRTDFDRRDGNSHDQKIEIVDRFGRITEFHFWDKSQGTNRAPKIHDWDVKSPRTDEFRYFTQNGDGTEINCNTPDYEKYAASVFDKPLSDQIIVYTFDGNLGSPYEGCQIELILSCQNIRAGSKTFQHKVLVGLVVTGDNRPQGITSWRGIFNTQEWLADRPDSTKIQWTFDGPNNESFTLSLSDETKLFAGGVGLSVNDISKGYELLPDPIGREDKVLVITPKGNFVSVAVYEAKGKTHLVADKPVFMLIPEKTKNGDERFTLPLPNDDKGNARQLILTKKDGTWQAIKETGGNQVPLMETSRRAKIYAGVFIVRPDKNRRKPSYHPPIGVFELPHNGKVMTVAMILGHDEATGYFSTAGQVSTTEWHLNEPPTPTLTASQLPTAPARIAPNQATVNPIKIVEPTSFTGDFNPFADDPTQQTGRLIIDLNGHGKLTIEGAKISHEAHSTDNAENLPIIWEQLIGELIQTSKPDNESATTILQDGKRLFIDSVGTITLSEAVKMDGHILVDAHFKVGTARPEGHWQDITKVTPRGTQPASIQATTEVGEFAITHPVDSVTVLPGTKTKNEMVFLMDDTGKIADVIVQPTLATISTTAAITSAYYRAFFINNERPVITYDIPNFPYTIECTTGFTIWNGQRSACVHSITAVARVNGDRVKLVSDGTTGFQVCSYNRAIDLRIDGIDFFISFSPFSIKTASYKKAAYEKNKDMLLSLAGLKTPVTKPEDYPALALVHSKPEEMGREAWQGWRLPDGGKVEIKLEKKTERNGKILWNFVGIKAGNTGQLNVRFQIGDMSKHAKGATKASQLEESADYQIVVLSELSMQVILDRKTGIVYPLQPSLKTLDDLLHPRTDWHPTKLPLDRVAAHVAKRKLAGNEKPTELVLPPMPVLALTPLPAPEPTPASPSPFNETEHLALVEIEKARTGFTESLLNFINTKTDDDALAFLAQVRQFLVTFHKTHNKNSAILTIIHQGVQLDRKPPIEKATTALKAMLATYP